jgi:hypothetical protein
VARQRFDHGLRPQNPKALGGLYAGRRVMAALPRAVKQRLRDRT